MTESRLAVQGFLLEKGFGTVSPLRSITAAARVFFLYAFAEERMAATCIIKRSP
jgi:hypothetical protein